MIKIKGNFHGKGTYFFADGDKYTGDWVKFEILIDYLFICLFKLKIYN